MANIVELREPLTFGKHSGLTGQELLKSGEGSKYLKWIYENTDIQMDMFVVEALVNAKLITRNFERRNSKSGGGVSFAQMYKDAAAHEHRNLIPEDGEGNLTQLLRQEGVNHLPQLIGRQVRVNVVSTPTAKEQHFKPVSLEVGRAIIANIRKEHGFNVDEKDIIADTMPSIEEQFRQRIAREVRSLSKDI